MLFIAKKNPYSKVFHFLKQKLHITSNDLPLVPKIPAEVAHNLDSKKIWLFMCGIAFHEYFPIG